MERALLSVRETKALHHTSAVPSAVTNSIRDTAPPSFTAAQSQGDRRRQRRGSSPTNVMVQHTSCRGSLRPRHRRPSVFTELQSDLFQGNSLTPALGARVGNTSSMRATTQLFACRSSSANSRRSSSPPLCSGRGDTCRSARHGAHRCPEHPRACGSGAYRSPPAIGRASQTGVNGHATASNGGD